MFSAISLGWGRQSFTLAAMSALGVLDKPDAAIFADTGHESILTYRFAEKWTPWLISHGVNVVTVHNPTSGNVDKWGGTFIPAFTFSDKGRGQLRRQCTHRWKVIPIRRWLQANRNRQPVTMQIGISTDEALRMKPSNRKYITHVWPLIDMHMSRTDCETWLTEHGLEIPPKSACTFCPYHDTEGWKLIQSTPQDWQEATAIDAAIRNNRPPYPLFVHPSRKPLDTVDLRTAEERGQLRLWDDECTGLCGI